jgi:hypothetical protein
LHRQAANSHWRDAWPQSRGGRSNSRPKNWTPPPQTRASYSHAGTHSRPYAWTKARAETRPHPKARSRTHPWSPGSHLPAGHHHSPAIELGFFKLFWRLKVFQVFIFVRSFEIFKVLAFIIFKVLEVFMIWHFQSIEFAVQHGISFAKFLVIIVVW